jgi:hypothetical protein
VTLLLLSTTGCEAVPGGAMPRASIAEDMVLAVNMAEHVPEPCVCV